MANDGRSGENGTVSDNRGGSGKANGATYSGNINESVNQLESKLMTEIAALKELIISNNSSSHK